MKNDRYFPLEICFWAGDNLSVMMYQIGGVQLVGIYVLLLYLCAKNDYSKSVVNSIQKPVEKSAVEKNSETPMDKGQKPNETQESRVEEKRNITTVVRTSDSVNDRGNEIVSPRLDPVQSTSCFCSAHGLSLLVPRVKYSLPTACRNSPTVCGNSPAACGDFHPRLLLQGFFVKFYKALIEIRVCTFSAAGETHVFGNLRRTRCHNFIHKIKSFFFLLFF